jgi:hypothetical protein
MAAPRFSFVLPGPLPPITGRRWPACEWAGVERAPYSHERHWDLWEAAAARLEEGDRYCSSPYWGLSLVESFGYGGALFVYRQDQEVAVFQELDVPGGRLILPCDGMWRLGSPLLARDPCAFLESLRRYWQARGSGLRQITVGGLYQSNPVWSSPIWRTHPHWLLSAAGRMVASLQGGCDGFLSRRSVNFRSRLRRCVKKSDREGVSVSFWPHRAGSGEVSALLERAMRVESRSWKGLAGQGVDQGEMSEFYRRMLPRLAERGRLRGLFLCRDGQDLAYLFGAAFAGYFRGLQFSYLEGGAEGLGNVAQWRMLEHMVEEGCLAYDLGQAMGYKTRWAELHIPSRAMGFQIGGQDRAGGA